MSWLSLYAPAPTVEGIWAQCTLTAQAAQGPHEERTLTQLRADVAAALLLNQTMAQNQIHTPAQPNTTADGTETATATGADGPDGTAAGGTAAGAGTAVVVPGDAQGPWFAPADPFTAAGGILPEPDAGPGAGGIPAWLVPVFDDPDYADPGFKDPDIRSGPDWDPTAIPPFLTPAPTNADNTSTSASISSSISTSTVGEGTNATNTTATGTGTNRSNCSVGPVWPPLPQVSPVLLIPALSLLGATNEPAWLEGVGPISMEVARHLTAGSASLLRVLVDPISNEPLDAAPERYRISKAMRTMLAIRDEYCQFPGCLAKATNCEVDHVKNFEHGGRSIYNNLETLCHRHHLLKHFKDDRTRAGECRTDQSPEREAVRLRGWTPAMVDGHVAWTSPTGRYYPPEIGDTQPPVYPKWLKELINDNLRTRYLHDNAELQSTADLENTAEFQDPQDFEDFQDFGFLDEADIPGSDQEENPYTKVLPVPPPGTFPSDEEQAALDEQTLNDYLTSNPDTA